MEKINKRPIIVGIFISIGLAILILITMSLGKQKNTFVKTFTINAIFDDVGGLLQGGNVWFSGVKIGTVKKISFYGDSKVLVTLSIEESAQSHLHKDTKAKLGSDGLIGNKIVVLYGGEPAAPEIQKDDYLAVEKSGSTDEMLATLQQNNKNLLEITANFKHISKSIDSGTGTISSLINDKEMANKLRQTINDLNVTVANFKTSSAESKTVLANMGSFSHKLNDPNNSVNKIIADTAMHTNLSNAIAGLAGSAYSISGFAGNLKTASERFNQKDNTVGLLLNDSVSAASVKTTLKNLESSSHKLDEDLEAVQHNFLLRGFFKKKNKG
ncbi:MlaD family protein [Parasediminibacterium sp. JCM 36343]|uniref:MlaD family protein n=1 Tax=Parasediminibacterium sp. JCM 36343 TaxID=3374279 RepID=UPI00397E4DB7